jgi:flagellar biosynthesis anti-sigma factor FlgM
MKIRETSRIAPHEIDKVYQTPERQRIGKTLPVGEAVKVSPEARILAAARDPETPDDRKIEQLKDAIRNGTFKVDVGRIADSILNEEVDYDLTM